MIKLKCIVWDMMANILWEMEGKAHCEQEKKLAVEWNIVMATKHACWITFSKYMCNFLPKDN